MPGWQFFFLLSTFLLSELERSFCHCKYTGYVVVTRGPSFTLGEGHSMVVGFLHWEGWVVYVGLGRGPLIGRFEALAWPGVFYPLPGCLGCFDYGGLLLLWVGLGVIVYRWGDCERRG